METTPRLVLSSEEEDKIVELIGTGQTISFILKTLKIGPIYFWEYRRAHPLFDERVKLARTCGASELFDKMPVIAELYVDPQQARAAMEGIGRYASMVDPKTYSPKAQIEVTQTLDITAIREAANARIVPLLDSNEVLEITAKSSSVDTEGESVKSVEDLF